jgi:hypothetical protein
MRHAQIATLCGLLALCQCNRDDLLLTDVGAARPTPSTSPETAGTSVALPSASSSGEVGVGGAGGLETTFGGAPPSYPLGRDVGRPCLPASELSAEFRGYTLGSVALERAGECDAGVCLVNRFQGRVSCPYGTPGSDSVLRARCYTPPRAGAQRAEVNPPVLPQLIERPAADAVQCSCRCAESDGRRTAGQTYCECPAGSACEPVFESLGLTGSEAGSYCVRGPAFNADAPRTPCDLESMSCGSPSPYAPDDTEELACAPGRKVCGGRCVDPTSDANHCGDCDNTCPQDTPRCVAMSCVP